MGRPRTTGLPAAIRAQLRLQAKKEAAERTIVLPPFTQAAKDAKAELDSIRDPTFRQMLLLNSNVEAVSLRTTYQARPAGIERFYLETWPRLVYANPTVRFGVQFHYTRAALDALNRSLVSQARNLDARAQEFEQSIAVIEGEREEQRQRRAQEAGVSVDELGNTEDPRDIIFVTRIENRRAELEALRNEAAQLQSRLLPLESLNPASTTEESQEAPGGRSCQATEGEEQEETGTDDPEEQVIGPLTPKSVVDARRAGLPVDFPVQHSLEVLYQSANPATQSFNLPHGADDDHLDVLRRVGLDSEASPDAPQSEVVEDVSLATLRFAHESPAPVVTASR